MVATIPVAVDAFLITLATVAIVLRFISRKLSGANFWYDDWLCLAALPFCITIDLSFWVAAYHGFGKHGGDSTFFQHVLYFDEVWYNLGITFTKLSVLCFYYRIFSITRPFRISLWVVGGLCVAWLIALTVASILQCDPIEKYWHRTIPGTCVYQYGFFLGQAIPNIILDFALLFLPMVPLWKLRMQSHQKWALTIVFILGYTNPMISVLRIVSFIQLGPDTGRDINYNFIGPALWSAAEVSVAIFSCSIPSLTYIFRRAVVFLAPSLKTDVETPKRTIKGIDGVKPATFGSIPSRNLKLHRTGSFKRLEDESCQSDTELGILRPTAKPSISAGPESMRKEGKADNYSGPAKQIQVRSDVDVSFEDEAVKAGATV
ncbi:hypothetical protein G7Y89_g6841 [Cudoniella acicularis]|uniref:Rhodopsin domain-containing protein n=1 Tax=Cudoniella acicularis TaxID=354080 RepID=A0A8H4W225_9HELO|nr:hypothetical protein G7Y89_g6841 [Cudoniella acicularis]